MKRQFFSQHYMPSLSLQRPVLLPTEMRCHLIAWAESDRDVVRFDLGGPAFRFVKQGREQVAAVSMTVQLRDGRAGYWEAVQADHVDEPDALRVMREHAALQGCDFFVLSPARINANLVEHKNRLSVFYLQLSAAQFDSAELESQLLMALSEGAASVKELTGRVAHSAGKVRVAAVRLWKRRLVNLPMSTQLLSDDWAVTRCGHALA